MHSPPKIGSHSTIFALNPIRCATVRPATFNACLLCSIRACASKSSGVAIRSTRPSRLNGYSLPPLFSMYSSICLRLTLLPQPLLGHVLVSISPTSVPRHVFTTTLLPHPGFICPSVANSPIIFIEPKRTTSVLGAFSASYVSRSCSSSICLTSASNCGNGTIGISKGSGPRATMHPGLDVRPITWTTKPRATPKPLLKSRELWELLPR